MAETLSHKDFREERMCACHSEHKTRVFL